MSGKYNYDRGKVYDTIFFITMYFREDDIITHFRNRFGDTEEAMQIYYEFKEKNSSLIIPSEIIAFVYCDYSNGFYSFLSNVLRDNLENDEWTKDNVIAFLRDKTKINELFWKHYYPNSEDGIAEQLSKSSYKLNISNTINQLNISNDIKLYLVEMVYNFKKFLYKLIEIINTIYPLIEALHIEKVQVIDDIKQRINDEKYGLINKFCNIFKISNNSPNIVFYFSLLNSFVVDFRSYKKIISFGLGNSFYTQIDSEFYLQHITLNSLSRVLCVDTRMDMLKMFLKYKELCAADIAHCLNISKSTVYLHLNIMLGEEMICYSNSIPKNNGERIYFSINSEYFKIYTKQATTIYQKTLKNKVKGIEKYDLPKRKRKSSSIIDYDEEKME